ncbi:MAG: hypothetical protein M3P18_12670 [Actinomycetota bacterium]|nr:hypothetical protein [Actinomycetota bacterium]
MSLPQKQETTQRLTSILDDVPTLAERMNAQAVLPVQAGLRPVTSRSTRICLLRVAMESALAAYWLVEPGITREVRRARTYAAQFQSLDERRKVEEAAHIITVPPAKSPDVRLSELIETASNEGLTKANKNGTIILALPMRSVIDLFDDYEEPPPKGGQASWVYRFMSGYSHGLQWAAMLNAQVVAPIEKVALGMVTANDAATVDMTIRAVRAIARAVDAYTAYRTATA